MQTIVILFSNIDSTACIFLISVLTLPKATNFRSSLLQTGCFVVAAVVSVGIVAFILFSVYFVSAIAGATGNPDDVRQAWNGGIITALPAIAVIFAPLVISIILSSLNGGRSPTVTQRLLNSAIVLSIPVGGLLFSNFYQSTATAL